MLYDLFICHASEDKDDFVRPLAEALRHQNVAVWYDEFTLSLGDSLRQAIDRGLQDSRFGLVVLSRAFFEKNWPQYELDGLVQREMAGADKVVLPIWLNVTQADVAGYSPTLAGRVAVSASQGLAKVVAAILRVVRPQNSPLVIARDLLLTYDVTPPVITDGWWLDVVEASNRIPGYGAYIPEESTWSRWSFPLPPNEGDPESRGTRLGWTALQLAWTQHADELQITVITRPEAVLDFIRREPGLMDTCVDYPGLAAEYAPQLTIPGFGGELEDSFESEYRKSLEEHVERRRQSPRFGTALTVEGDTPDCDEEWVFRSKCFGKYQSSFVAEAYFHAGIFGPRVAYHEDADHLFWLLSDESGWLPEKVRATLLDGLARCTARWLWSSAEHSRDEAQWLSRGALQEELWKLRRTSRVSLSARAHDDVLNREALAQKVLRLPESSKELAQRFFDAMFRHLDLTLREIGVQDLGVGRRIKIMAEGLHGRALAYREALAGGPTALGEVLRRNAYGGRPPADAEAVARLETHVRHYAARLAATPRNDLIK